MNVGQMAARQLPHQSGEQSISEGLPQKSVLGQHAADLVCRVQFNERHNDNEKFKHVVFIR